jgi:hypothetical protein
MRGGARKNTGPKKGSKHASTLSKEAARECLRQIVTREMEAMTKAQIANAKGIQHFFLRDEKTKQFMRIEDPKAIETALNCGDEGSYYWIFTKDPSVQAFTDLMNRALDKPSEQVQIQQDINVHIHQEIRSKIQEALVREEKLIESRSSKPS